MLMKPMFLLKTNLHSLAGGRHQGELFFVVFLAWDLSWGAVCSLNLLAQGMVALSAPCQRPFTTSLSSVRD